MIRLVAIVLVVAGSCLFCAGVIGAGWVAWSGLSGASLPQTMPGPGWLAGAVAAGVVLAIAGRELMRRAESG